MPAFAGMTGQEGAQPYLRETLLDPESSVQAAAEARRVAALRMQMLDHHPFWGHLLLTLKLIPAPTLDALAATDGVKRVWYNPTRTAALPLPQLGFVLAHEVGHLVFASAARARGRQHVWWNRATDFAINRVVSRIADPLRPGRPLYQPPPGVLLDRRFDGWIAEAIYEELLGQEPPPTLLACLDLGGGLEARVVDHGGGLDLHLPVELDAEAEADLRARLGAALDAWRQAEGRGDVPGDVERWIGRPGRAKVPWARLLQRVLGEALVPDDLSLARPNRRLLAAGVLVPGLTRREQRRLVLAVDTSGSMGPAELAAAGAEIAALADVEPHITLLAADARVQRVVSARDLPRALRDLRLPGGGGTDHRPVFAWVAAQREAPDLFVGLADLYSRFPERPPRYPVWWVTPRHHGAAPFGRVIEMT